MGQGEGVGFRCRSRPGQGLVQKSQCVEWGSLQPFSRDARGDTTPWATYGSTASSATAASMPPGSGPRHRRRSSKRCMGPRGRPRLSGASATVAWASVSSGGSRRARTGLRQRWGSVLHEGPYWLSHQLLSAFAAMDREPGSRRPISAIEAPWALKFEVRTDPARSNPRKKNTRFLRIFATRER